MKQFFRFHTSLVDDLIWSMICISNHWRFFPLDTNFKCNKSVVFHSSSSSSSKKNQITQLLIILHIISLNPWVVDAKQHTQSIHKICARDWNWIKMWLKIERVFFLFDCYNPQTTSSWTTHKSISLGIDVFWCIYNRHLKWWWCCCCCCWLSYAEQTVSQNRRFGWTFPNMQYDTHTRYTQWAQQTAEKKNLYINCECRLTDDETTKRLSKTFSI